MKKIIFIATCFAFTSGLWAQTPEDALRFSWSPGSGTARQQAIGGAGGSLGGDISSTFINPAGLGFYKTGDFVLSPGYSLLTNKASYFGRTEKDMRNGFKLGTTGFVSGSPSGGGRKLSSSAFALAVNTTANFNSNLLYRGQNNESSYSQKFLEEIGNNQDANSVANDYPFGTSLAFNTYWVDTANGWGSGNKQFVSLATPLLGTGLLQEQSVITKGGITEVAVAGAANFGDKFYIGGTLGIPFLHYSKESHFIEADATSNANNNFDFASIDENLTTDGAGVNVKAGLIYKPSEYVRLGLAIHSPTFFSLTDKYNASVTANTEGYQGELTQNSGTFTSGQDGQFKYTLTTPYKIIGSASYVLREVEDVRNQKGFLTADVEFVNYKALSFNIQEDASGNTDDKAYLKSLNKAIDNAYKAALNFRVGGELKFTTLMVRLGAAYYGNPYKDIVGENGHRFLMTGGLGYRDKGFFIDLGYAYTMGKDVSVPYRLQNSPFGGASVKNTGGNAVLTIGFKI